MHANLKPVQIRLSTFHLALLRRLVQKKGIDRSNIIRLAITALAEAEGLLPGQGKPSPK